MPFSEVYRRDETVASPTINRFKKLLTNDNSEQLEAMASDAMRLTRQYFGRTMRMFAPLYVSNECVNICKYCGFSRNNPILRVTLSLDEVESEARHLVEQGFRSILLVAGEHPKFVSNNYLVDCVRRLRPIVPSIALEVGPMEADEYRPIVEAGAEALIVYQETYNTEAYTELHTAGPKKDFWWRLDCPERAFAAGFRRIGIGALYGLAPWEEEAIAVARHTEYLLRHCWKASITISLPRLRPAAGEFEPRHIITDRELVRVVCALRICFPQVGIVLSTRETAAFRDGLIPLAITSISAGSHTEPGGYTGAGRDSLHRTEKGRAVPIIPSEGEYAQATGCSSGATEQFNIADERSASEMAEVLRQMGLEPVWKDWDQGLTAAESNAASA